MTPMTAMTPETTETGMSDTTQVLSVRMDGALFDRLHTHAERRGMSVQDYVVRTLVRDDFDERFRASVDETERFYGSTA